MSYQVVHKKLPSTPQRVTMLYTISYQSVHVDALKYLVYRHSVIANNNLNSNIYFKAIKQTLKQVIHKIIIMIIIGIGRSACLSALREIDVYNVVTSRVQHGNFSAAMW